MRASFHAGAFNLSLVLSKKLGAGTPRDLAAAKKGLRFALGGYRAALFRRSIALASALDAPGPRAIPNRPANPQFPFRVRRLKTATSATGC